MIENGYGEMHPKVRKIHIVYHLLVVGILKAMPIFGELMLKDKVAMNNINNIVLKINFRKY